MVVNFYELAAPILISKTNRTDYYYSLNKINTQNKSPNFIIKR